MGLLERRVKMALSNVEVPIWNNKEEVKLFVDEFAGRMILRIREPMNREICIEVLFDDLERAWQAVKRY
jgi:hypothetical protein